MTSLQEIIQRSGIRFSFFALIALAFFIAFPAPVDAFSVGPFSLKDLSGKIVHAAGTSTVTPLDNIYGLMSQDTGSNVVTNGTQDYLFTNNDAAPIDYSVETSDSWVGLQICSAITNVPLAPVTNSADNSCPVSSTTFHGTVDTEGSVATAWFEIQDKNGNPTGPFGVTNLSALSGNQTVSFSLGSGATLNTTYIYRIATENGSGTFYGDWVTFATPRTCGSNPPNNKPVVVTNDATAVGVTIATVNGAVVGPKCSTGDCYHTYFWIGLSPLSLNKDSALDIPGTQGNSAFRVTMSNLVKNTTYFFKACADDQSKKTGCGVVLNFTTACPTGLIPDGIGTGLCKEDVGPPIIDCSNDGSPVVTTRGATAVTVDSATLNGVVTSLGDPVVSIYFRFGKSRNSLNSTVPLATRTMNTTGNFSENISTLDPGTYYYSAFAKNSFGESCENILSFTIDPTICTILPCTKGVDDGIDDGQNFLNENNAVKAIQVVGLATGALVTAIAFAMTMPNLRLWSLVLLLFGIVKRKEPTWGIVYDSVTKKPLDPVFLELVDQEGKQVATSITDSQGRYGFLVPPGTYMIRPRFAHYVFPSIVLAHVTRDEMYDHLYFGNYFELKKHEQLITMNIPLDREHFDQQDFEKHEERIAKLLSKNSKFLSRSADVLFILGLIISVLAFIILPNTWNIVILGVYIAILIIREMGISLSKLGTVIDKKTGRPLAYAVVRVYSASLGNEVVRKITTEYGRFYCLIPNGEYFIAIEKKNPNGTYTRLLTSPKVVVKNERINGVWKVDDPLTNKVIKSK